MFSLLENPLAINDERLLTLQGRRLERVDNGIELKIGDFTASMSWLKSSLSLFTAVTFEMDGEPLMDW